MDVGGIDIGWVQLLDTEFGGGDDFSSGVALFDSQAVAAVVYVYCCGGSGGDTVDVNQQIVGGNGIYAAVDYG